MGLLHAHSASCPYTRYDIIMSGLNASSEFIPITRSRTREVAGWTDHVKPEKGPFSFLALDVVRIW